jgi:hypothetical protein
MFVVNGAPEQINLGWGSVEYTDHLSLIRGLVASCDSCLLVSISGFYGHNFSN